eukprot:CAMPEP_0181496434 /NCGR_PEP_ID=MMETSP1110-20121109/52971_1 /TAXON_ID=174948 /ORGANISM="Symbiodinium sp., Strain CCMP421" /LENGTH=39 /DNA_ID= /DNA_START= /DNA_END= /DNA_ORIENTATION=
MNQAQVPTAPQVLPSRTDRRPGRLEAGMHKSEPVAHEAW